MQTYIVLDFIWESGNSTNIRLPNYICESAMSNDDVYIEWYPQGMPDVCVTLITKDHLAGLKVRLNKRTYSIVSLDGLREFIIKNLTPPCEPDYLQADLRYADEFDSENSLQSQDQQHLHDEQVKDVPF